MMQKKVLLAATIWMCMMLLGITSLAQPGAGPGPEGGAEGEGRKERIERLKRAFISERLDLTVEEAEKFWPVYNEFNKKRQMNREAIRKAHKRMKTPGITEKEILSISAEITAARHTEVDTDDEYLKKVLPILGPEKTAKMIQVEEEFRREMMQKLKEKKEARPR